MPRPPTVVVLMAEFCDWFLWNRSPGRDSSADGGPLDPADLGVSPGLIERMAAWNDEYGTLGRTDFQWPSAEQEQSWRLRGLGLAYELQNELGPDIQVLYHHDGDERPVRERRGP